MHIYFIMCLINGEWKYECSAKDLKEAKDKAQGLAFRNNNTYYIASSIGYYQNETVWNPKEK